MGTRVDIEGALKLNTWTGQDGAERSGLNLAARVVQPMGAIGRRRPSKPKSGGVEVSEAARDWQRPVPADADGQPIDQIPF